jgi:hypothetical protein
MSVNPRINITTINNIETKTTCFNCVRYYDPSLQRFLGEDPIGFSGEDFNFYRYCTGHKMWICRFIYFVTTSSHALIFFLVL